MNFHIFNKSPLRPQFSSSLNASGPQPPGHDYTHPGPVKIAVEPADDVSSSSGIDTSDDSDDDEKVSLSAIDATAQVSRDVLVQRLTNLVKRLSSDEGANVETASIQVLHRQADEMERVLGSNGRDRSASSRRQRPVSLQLPLGGGGGEGGARGRDSLGVMAPISPSWLMSRFQRRPSVQLERQDEELEGEEVRKIAAEAEVPVRSGRLEVLNREPRLASSLPPTEIPRFEAQRPALSRLASFDSSTTAPRISSQVAEDAIKEAEKLCAEMATVIESLQTRREESDVIPSL